MQTRFAHDPPRAASPWGRFPLKHAHRTNADPRARSPWGSRGQGPHLPSVSPHETAQTAWTVKAPTALARPGHTPASPPKSSFPHDFVLVRDELVYVFQIKLVRHGAVATDPADAGCPLGSVTAAAPAGGKRLRPLPGPGSFPTATGATRYGGRPRVKLVSETAQAEVGGDDGSRRHGAGVRVERRLVMAPNNAK